MARNETHVDAPPAAVWEVLADGYSYGEWVVGSAYIRHSEPGWPAAGTRIHHKVGIGPLKLEDRTKSLDSVPEHRLELDARALPVGRARVVMELAPEGAGTRVTMIEDPSGFVSPLRLLPPVHLAIGLRNVESLRRLKRLAEDRHRRRRGSRSTAAPQRSPAS